ncbi:hypothetical protein ACWDXV_16565 [Nocardia nova]
MTILATGCSNHESNFKGVITAGRSAVYSSPPPTGTPSDSQRPIDELASGSNVTVSCATTVRWTVGPVWFYKVSYHSGSGYVEADEVDITTRDSNGGQIGATGVSAC